MVNIFDVYCESPKMMEVLMNKNFNGRHSETGSIHNALALQGVTAPHTGEPYSEAFLLGVSGGIALC
jgi:hypothetical protein